MLFKLHTCSRLLLPSPNRKGAIEIFKIALTFKVYVFKWIISSISIFLNKIYLYCFSVTESCPILCDPMDCCIPGFLVLHYLLEFAQLMPIRLMMLFNQSQPLSPPSPPALSLNEGLFQWVGSSNQVAKVLELQFQHQSFQWIFKVDFLYDGLVWFPCCPRDSQESSPALQFKSTNSQNLKCDTFR